MMARLIMDDKEFCRLVVDHIKVIVPYPKSGGPEGI